MPHAVAHRRGHPRIKAEAGSPDHDSNIANGPTVTHTANGSSSENIYEASSVGGDTIPINGYRNDRSDARKSPFLGQKDFHPDIYNCNSTTKRASH